MQLAPLLVAIAEQSVSDVRKALKKWKEELIRMIVDGEPDPLSTIQMDFAHLDTHDQTVRSHTPRSDLSALDHK